MIPKYPIADDAVYCYWLKAAGWTQEQATILILCLNPASDEVQKWWQSRKRGKKQYDFDLDRTLARKSSDIMSAMDHVQGVPQILPMEDLIDPSKSPEYWLKVMRKAEIPIPVTLDAAIQLSKSATKPKPLSTHERNQMLEILLGMAIAKYGYDPSAARNQATGGNRGSIAADMQTVGLSAEPDTIRKYLAEAANMYPDAKAGKS